MENKNLFPYASIVFRLPKYFLKSLPLLSLCCQGLGNLLVMRLNCLQVYLLYK